MHTLISPQDYYRDEIFHCEQNQIFENTWQFAGFTTDVLENDAMFCKDIAGKSVVIKNFNGELKAFHNVCSHRFSRICNGKGKGPLQCPYHGWTYNEVGEPYAIPKRKQFDNLDVQNLKLKPYQINVCGKFIFVKAASNGLTLQEYLGSAAYFLNRVSDALGLRLDENSMEVAANWKLVVENTLEDYHVREVHPESLYTVGIKASTLDVSSLHSSTSMQFETQLEKHKKLAGIFASRPWVIEDYVQQLIFPNLTIASAFGTTVSIQEITPLSATRTRFVSHVFATPLEEAVLNSALVKAFNQSAVDFNRQVFLEDKTICEAVQKGIMEAVRQQGPLCTDEERVWAFQKAYLELMKGVEG